MDKLVYVGILLSCLCLGWGFEHGLTWITVIGGFALGVNVATLMLRYTTEDVLWK